jgi:integrase
MANVTLRQKEIANNKSSLYLDYYPPIISAKTGKETRREFLNLKVFNYPSTQIEKEHNKTTIEFGNLIKSKRLIQLRDREFGFKENMEIKVDFIEYYGTIVLEYYNKGSKSNYSTWKASLSYFKLFMGNKMSAKNLSPEIVKRYREFLLTTTNLRTNKQKLSINTASSYFNQFIAVLKRAYRERIIHSNLAEQAVFIKLEETFREYLSEEELVKLWNTDIKFPQIKRAAFFAALTGFRFVDVKNLTWDRVFTDKHQGFYIQLKEEKTGNIHNHPISANAHEILKLENTSTGIVFQNLEYYRTPRTIKDWVEAAGIIKKISFHNFRHTYATLQLANGTDLYVVSKLLGHKSVKTTQIYAKVIDKKKIEAANRINLDLHGLSD